MEERQKSSKCLCTFVLKPIIFVVKYVSTMVKWMQKCTCSSKAFFKTAGPIPKQTNNSSNGNRYILIGKSTHKFPAISILESTKIYLKHAKHICKYIQDIQKYTKAYKIPIGGGAAPPGMAPAPVPFISKTSSLRYVLEKVPSAKWLHKLGENIMLL